MAAETQYTANTGLVTISTANTNLDGTGTMGTVLTAAGNGTLIKSITVKAHGVTTQGMVRLFINNGTQTKLFREVLVPAVTPNATSKAFEAYLLISYALQAGDILYASTQNAEIFGITAEGMDFAYYSAFVRPESTKYFGNTGVATVSTANSNLDGTGTIATVLTAANSGTNIKSITVKAQGTTTPGMVRIFLQNSGATVTELLTEIPVMAKIQTATAHTFAARINFGGNDFSLKSGYSILASTQNAETFNVIAEGLNWYPA
jgi:hypothetical protein